MRRRRRSTMSARAPAGRARTNIGTDVATCTMDTRNGSGLSPVISQPAAAFCIQTPTLDTTVAIQSTEKVAWRKGASVDASAAGFIFSLIEGVSGPGIAISSAGSVALRLSQVQPRHQKKGPDQTEALEKAVHDR